MANPKKTRNSSNGRAGSRLGSFLAGFLMAAALAGGAWYFAGVKPKRVVEPARPAPAPGATHLQGGRLPEPPFGISEDVFEAGARTYSRRCAVCHGVPGQKAAPSQAEQFFAQGGLGALPPGAIYEDLRKGSARTPADHGFAKGLTEIQIWQLAWLLKNSNQMLPDPVTKLLKLP